MNERSVFIGALERDDPEQRNVYLTDTCGADSQLRQRVERLLAAHAAASGVLDRPVVDVQQTSPMAGGESQAGTLIAGRYKLLEEIGEGGMGTVWVAEQTQPVRRRVALKLIKPGMDSSASAVALRGRTAGAGPDGPSEHRQSARWRRDRSGPAVLRDGVRQRRTDHRLLRPGPALGAGSAQAVRASLPGGAARRIRRASSTATSSRRTFWSACTTASRCPR